MITTAHYFDTIQPVQVASWPETLQKGHAFVEKATDHGQSWQSYESNETIKKVIDLYLSTLNAYLAQAGTSSPVGPVQVPVQSSGASVSRTKKKNPPIRAASPIPTEVPATSTAPVERLPEEIRFIRRFVQLDGKTKTKQEIVRLINALQKAIVEKRIRKTSPYAEQVRFIQHKLIQVHNTMHRTITIELKPETVTAMKEVTVTQQMRPATQFIKRYLQLQGKPSVKEKAERLLHHIERDLQKGNITAADPYYTDLERIRTQLQRFTADKKARTLVIEENELHGLHGKLAGSDGLNGIAEKPVLMNSLDFANLQFHTIGLAGKWRALIGDPSRNFTAMVFGKPKMGKSYLCVEFAGYLARHHGKVLYVAKEEGLDQTLQKKLADKNVAHANLFVSAILPEQLHEYDFVFLDSVNRLGLQSSDLLRLKAEHPTTSFIFIFQSTKAGKFRGENAFQHDVDVVIEIPEKGKAVQYGRFNQGGALDIFPTEQAAYI